MSKYTHAKPIEYKLPKGPLWPYKHNNKQIEQLKHNSFLYNAQYNQDPIAKGSNLINISWFREFSYFDETKNIICLLDGSKLSITRKIITIDTAMKTHDRADYTVFLLSGRGQDGNIYLLDLYRAKPDIIQMTRDYISFCEKHTSNLSKISTSYCELKANGIALQQTINNGNKGIRITGLERNVDKVFRLSSILWKIEQGNVFLPKNAMWKNDALNELKSFNELNTHKHDDIVDTVIDAIELLGQGLYYDIMT